MNKIYNSDNIFFDDWAATLKEMGGYSGQFTDKMYGQWIKVWSEERHHSIVSAMDRFIDENDFRLGYQHFTRMPAVAGFEEKWLKFMLAKSGPC